MASWEALAKAAALAYGGETSAAGRGGAALVKLAFLRGAPLPLAQPLALPGKGVGLAATRAVRQGEVVLAVPRALWQPHSGAAALAAARSGAPAFAHRIDAVDARLAAGLAGPGAAPPMSVAPLAALAMQILFATVEGPDAAYVAWLRAAHPPAAMANAMPAFWGQARRRELQACELASQGGPLDRLPALASTLHAALFGGGGMASGGGLANGSDPEVTKDNGNGPPVALLLWALSLVQSRATGSAGAAATSTAAAVGASSPAFHASFPFSLVPYFDLLNHEPGGRPNCAHAFSDTGAYSVGELDCVSPLS